MGVRRNDFLSHSTMTDPTPSLRARLQALPEPEWHTWLDDASFGVTPADEAELIELATGRELLDIADGDHPDYWVPVHAWRALAVLGSERAVEPLLDVVAEWNGDDWIAQDFPAVFGRIGGGAVPALRALGVDVESNEFARMSVAEALARVGANHPAHRDACVEALSAMLEGFGRESEELNGVVISCLVDLDAREAAPLMERAFDAGKVDLLMMGDWEDVQIEIGLLDARITPRPPGTPTWDPDDDALGSRLPGWRSLTPEGAEVLGRVFGEGAVRSPVTSLRELEGFLFALACSPELVRPAAWIEVLLPDGLGADSLEEANTVLQHLVDLYNRMQRTVNEGLFRPPDGLFRDDVMSNFEHDAEAAQWGRGFARGHGWLAHLWEVADPDEQDYIDNLVFDISFFGNPEAREAVFAGIGVPPGEPFDETAALVLRGWPETALEYAEMGFELAARREQERRRPVRAEERIGRNDPCPCGSGRKFKKCCGKSVH